MLRCSITSAVGFALILAIPAACETTTPTPVSPVASSSPTSSDDPPATKKDSGAAVQENPFSAGGKLCGCALCEPVVSDDACTKDDDCAPKTACHAKACVGKANAEVRAPNTMCTQDLHCDSTDTNACGCLKGKCALYKR